MRLTQLSLFNFRNYVRLVLDLPAGVTVLLGDCLLYTSDAADDLLCVDLGGRRTIKKKKNNKKA